MQDDVDYKYARRDDMKEIRIKLDYLHGPIWKEKIDISTGNWYTGVACVDNDSMLQALNSKAEQLYSSLYSFDEGEGACSFDEEGYEAVREELLFIIRKIISRLEEINDGTYIVSDEATQSLLAN